VRLVTGELLASNVEWYKRKGYKITQVEQTPDRRIVHMAKTLA